MTATKGYYGLVQYFPDMARLECANVGVLLFCPDTGFIEARLARGNDRIRHFFGKDYPDLDLDRLNAAKRAIENRLRVEKENFRSLDDLLKFVNTRANEFRISQPRPIKVIQPEEVLQSLFKELVGERPQRVERQPLFPELEKTFRRLQERLPQRIFLKRQVPVPRLGRIDVDYGFHNGCQNWVRTQKFDGDNARITETAAKLAMEGRFIDKYSAEEGNPQKLIVVSWVPPTRCSDVEPKIKRIFKELGTGLITQDQTHSFAQTVQQEAH